MSDLLETISTIFPPVLSGHLAARLGTSSNSMKRAIEGAVPVMLGGLTAVATKNPALGYEWCQQVQPAQPSVTGILALLGRRDAAASAFTQNDRLLRAAFGNSEQVVVSELSQYAKLQPALVRTLLELVGTVLLGALGQYATRHRLAADDTVAVLAGSKAKVKALLPRELQGLVEAVGQGAAPRWKTNPMAIAHAVMRQTTAQQTRPRWYVVAAAVLLGTGVGLAAFGALHPRPVGEQAIQVVPAQTVQVITTVAAEGTSAVPTDF